MDDSNSENIFFVFKDKENENENENENSIDDELLMQDLLDEFNMNFEQEEDQDQEPNFFVLLDNKTFQRYNVNELLKICDYYGLIKYIKLAKYKKPEIIHSILLFEKDESNREIVEKRYKMWNYMSELAKDKLMKKYIIWN